MKNLIRRSLLSACLLAGAFCVFTGSNARAQGNLSFSGGDGAPLELTLDAPVTYQITAASMDTPVFDFQSADPANVFDGTYGATTGSTITFEVNGGTPLAITGINSGVSVANIAASDLYIFASGSTNLAVGDTITLNPGNLFTTASVAAAPPANGSFTSYMTNDNGTQESGVGISAAPEPGTWAMLGLGGTVLVGASRLRRRRTARGAMAS